MLSLLVGLAAPWVTLRAERRRMDLTSEGVSPGFFCKSNAQTPASCGAAADVPDPYYGGVSGFDDVFEMVRAACVGLLAQITADLPR